MLSTGVSLEDPLLRVRHRRHQLSVRNFVSDSEDGEDRYGHGTHCAGIIAKLGPRSQLFVAKVADGQGISDPSVIAKVCSSFFKRIPEF